MTTIISSSKPAPQAISRSPSMGEHDMINLGWRKRAFNERIGADDLLWYGGGRQSVVEQTIQGYLGVVFEEELASRWYRFGGTEIIWTKEAKAA